MRRSAVSRFADWLTASPTWLEQNGDIYVHVRGYSPLSNLFYGAIVAAVILAPVILFLVATP